MNKKTFNKGKLGIIVALFLLLSGSLATMSFTSSPGETKSESKAGSVYYWYNPTTGVQLSETASETSPNGCPNDGETPCAIGFLSPTANPLSSTPNQTEYKQP